ncbi:kinase binding protein CGI-121-domain-containing protein [Lineolata rhizophorae]|uniref:EKC/KEOPS complex subunit CGI121 n=1 Tax=Lineolata rhizophorae TaxID=578093 RepID=A0A6A6P325_9PEZI|nr:kinase binding protein CGI-121-domain-containing protein [Lineolata rhizophorae]
MTSIQTLRLPHLPQENPIFAACFVGVQNAAFLRQQLLQGNSEYEYAFLDATTILSVNHLLAAVFRAVNDMLYGRLKSRNVHSEIVYCLSPNNNIAESFRRFGITESTTALLAVKVGMASHPNITAESVVAHLNSAVQGQPVSFNNDELQSLTDLDKLRKFYKLEGPKPQPKRPARQIATNGAQDSLETSAESRLEMECTILGLMALRGS